MTGGQDAELVAIFGDRTPGDLNIMLFCQQLDDGIITQRLGRALPVDILDNFLFDAGGSDIAAALINAAVKKVFEFKNPVRGLHLLTLGHPADRRFMHFDIIGNITQH